MYKVTVGDVATLITGHVYPEFSEAQLESIGLVDVVVIPVGGHGYTLDPQGALTIIKEIEPKFVIPTNYDIENISYPVPQLKLNEALKELSMETHETLPKLKIKSSEIGDATKLIVLEVS
jgi:L-ascorbate metabolism protein UlaG (beta-lactamase superfamily)